MEIWRVGYGEDKLPAVISRRTLAIAFVIHLAFFALFWAYSAFNGLFDKEEEIVPIDLTVVVNENLDGKENEPPPLKNPEPEKLKPKPKPQPKPKVKEPEKPKELEKIVTNIVAKVDKKEEKATEKAKAKEKEPVKPAEPKKTAKELREERMKKMRESAKTVNKPVRVVVPNAQQSGDGRTDKKTFTDAQIRDLLNKGYKPGTSEQLAASDAQLGYSLIKMAVEDKWDVPPWTDTLRPMTVRIWFGGGGRVVNYKLEKSSGDAKADRSILSAASRVGAIPGLPPAFINAYKSKGIPCQFTVRPH